MTEYSHRELNALLESYKNGTISETDRFQLEKQALDDPFLFDALEGYTLHLNADKKEKKAAAIFTLPRIGIAASIVFLLAVLFNLSNRVDEVEPSNERISMVMEDDEVNSEPEDIATGVMADQEIDESPTASSVKPTEIRSESSKTNVDRKPVKTPSPNRNTTNQISEEEVMEVSHQSVVSADDSKSTMDYDVGKSQIEEGLVLSKDQDTPKQLVDGVPITNTGTAQEGVPNVTAFKSEKTSVKGQKLQMPESQKEMPSFKQEMPISQKKMPEAQLSEKRKKMIADESNVSLAYYEAVPVIGKEIFDDYAKQRIDERGLRQAEPQKVVIEFSIDKNGQLTNFKHIYSGCSECGPFAITILQNSGEWKTVPPGFSGRARYTFIF